MVKSKKKSKKRGSYHKGGESARLGTLNVKCPNMDCGTEGLPGACGSDPDLSTHVDGSAQGS